MPLTRINTGDVGLATEVNYVSPSLSNWRTYNDGDSNVPLDGTGGSPNVTFVRDSSAPLNSTGDYRFTKGGSASRRGQGVSVDFTVENRHLGKVLQVVLDYELVSGTLATDDLRLYVVQDPNGTPVLVEPVNTSLQGTVSGYGSTRHVATFQTHVSLKTYRLCLHVRSTSALDYTVDFANFRVGEPTVSTGAVITEPTRYTPVIQGSSTVINDEVYWTRYGKNLSLSGRLQLGTVSSSEFRLFLPFTISSEVTNLRVFGRIYVNTTYTTSPQWVLKGVGGQNYLTLGVADTTGNNAFTNMNITSAFGTNTILTFLCNEIPVAGWGSSVAMSSDTGDSRVVACRVANLVGNTNTDNGFYWSTIIYDTHGMVRSTGSGATQRTEVVVPVSGIYRVSFTINYNNTGAHLIYKNGSTLLAETGYGSVTSIGQNNSTTISLNAGDYIHIRTGNAVLSNTYSNAALTVERISAGSQVIASSETVACSYWLTGNTASTTSAIPFGASGAGRFYDTHGAMVNGTFTAPMNGIYLITGHIASSTTSDWIEVWVDGAFNRRRFLIDAGYTYNSVMQIRLLAGQTLQLRPLSPIIIYGSSTPNNGGVSQIEIIRIGL